MPKPEKVETVANLREKLARCRGAVLADYRGLSVATMTELRRRFRAAGVEYRVVRNNLFRLAAREAGRAGLDPYLEGPTAVAFAYDDPVAAARVLQGFIREFKLPAVKAAWVEGQVVDAEGVARLAELPGRDVLLARVLGGVQAPLAGLAGCLGGLLRGLVTALDAVRRQKEEAVA
ncbi:MAG: 50S ribosomal protein L10 [Bacillota bacterium]|nr:50S ribosomal protein L10 [Bacillota bacterium]MDI7249334.1 50S ribosomal protein L10 [Bacillota bacterium]